MGSPLSGVTLLHPALHLVHSIMTEKLVPVPHGFKLERVPWRPACIALGVFYVSGGLGFIDPVKGASRALCPSSLSLSHSHYPPSAPHSSPLSSD